MPGVIPLDVNQLQSFFADENNRKDCVVVFPGKFETKNTGLYTVKDADPIWKSLGEHGVATLNLPIKTEHPLFSDDKKIQATQAAIADMWRAIGKDLNLVLPTSNGQALWNQFSSPQIANIYKDNLEHIRNYLAGDAAVRLQIQNKLKEPYKSALLAGIRMMNPTPNIDPNPENRKKYEENQQWFSQQPEAGIGPSQGNIKTPSKTKNFSFNDDTWQKLEGQQFTIDKPNKIATFQNVEKTIDITVDPVNGIKSKIGLTKEAAEKMVRAAFEIYPDKAELTIKGKDQAETDLLTKTFQEIKQKEYPNKSFALRFAGKKDAKKEEPEQEPKEEKGPGMI